jgi:two-component system nitrate/nitrite response regulator NarL
MREAERGGNWLTIAETLKEIGGTPVGARSNDFRITRASSGEMPVPAAAVMKVLCVDSNILSYGLVRVLNELFGDVNVRSVHTIGELLDIAAGGERFDLVLLDARVPDLDRFAGLRRAVESLPGAAFIVISPEEHPADISSAIKAGARGFVPMSSRLDVLRYALPLILKGEFYVPASVFRNGGSSGALDPAPTSAPTAVAPGTETLTRRQFEVLLMLAAGKSNKEIARQLQLLDGTVKLHVKAILRKLGVNNRTQAVMAAARAGYLPKDLLGT